MGFGPAARQYRNCWHRWHRWIAGFVRLSSIFRLARIQRELSKRIALNVLLDWLEYLQDIKNALIQFPVTQRYITLIKRESLETNFEKDGYDTIAKTARQARRVRNEPYQNSYLFRNQNYYDSGIHTCWWWTTSQTVLFRKRRIDGWSQTSRELYDKV
jgi:hypothetical protein